MTEGTTVATMEKIQSNVELPKWQSIVNNLKKGYIFVKYSKAGFKPHQKKVYLSRDEDELVSVNHPGWDEQKVISL